MSSRGSPSGIRAGRAYVELGVDDKFTKALRAAEARLKAFGASIRNIGLALTGVAAAASAPFVAGVKLFSDFGDSLDKAAIRTGLSVEAVSELGFAAEQSGTDIETLEKGLRVMQRTVVAAGEGSASAADALGKLGLSAGALANLSPEDQISLVADRIMAITDPAERAAAAIGVFGKAGAGLIPLLEEGSQGIAELRKQARDFGISVSADEAKSAALLNDTLNLLARSAKAAAFQIGAALAPVITELAERAAHVVGGVVAWIRANRDLVVTAAKVVAVVGLVGVTLVGVGFGISLLGTAIGGIATAFGIAVKSILLAKAAFLLLASPLGIVVALAASATAAILYFSGAGGTAIAWLGERFAELRERVTSVLGAVGDALMAGDFALAARVAWLGVRAEWIRGINFLQDRWTEFKAWFATATSEVFGGARIWAIEIWSGFETAAAEAMAFVGRIWNALVSTFWSAFESVTGWLADRLLELMGLVDTTLDVEAAKKARREDSARSQSAIDATNRSNEEEIAKRLEGRLTAAEARRDAAIKAIGEGLVQGQERITTARDGALAENARELAAAQAELTQAIEAARAARASSDASAPERRGIPAIDDILAGFGQAQQRAEVRGTFSAAATQSLQSGGGGPLERIAKSSEDSARLLRRLLDKAADNGLVFQE